MKTPPPLSSELEALLAPHRAVLPLAPAIEARAVARAAAVAESREPGGGRAFVLPRWAFAVAAGVVLAFGAGAYAAYAWRVAAPTNDAGHRAPVVATPADQASPAAANAAPADGDDETSTTIAPSAAPHPRRNVSSVGRVGMPSLAPVRPTNAELQLLRSARQDVTNGDFAGALTTIAEHARRFRNGALVEEREALRVKSLAGLGRHEDARRAAAQFHARFPHSVFLATFERMNEADR